MYDFMKRFQLEWIDTEKLWYFKQVLNLITVHEDQIDDKECLRVRLPPNHVKFADASREYDSIPVPVFVPVAPNPTVAQEVHYPKDIVYADLADISLEEIKAQQYFEKYAPIFV